MLFPTTDYTESLLCNYSLWPVFSFCSFLRSYENEIVNNKEYHLKSIGRARGTKDIFAITKRIVSMMLQIIEWSNRNGNTPCDSRARGMCDISSRKNEKVPFVGFDDPDKIWNIKSQIPRDRFEILLRTQKIIFFFDLHLSFLFLQANCWFNWRDLQVVEMSAPLCRIFRTKRSSRILASNKTLERNDSTMNGFRILKIQSWRVARLMESRI